jgi:PDZ domain/Carboxypeptidase regulatory-like domain
VLDDGARVHGIVTSHGRPVPQVTVKIDSEHATVSLDTDDHGAFEIEGVAPAHYTFEVSNRGGALPIVSGPHEVEVAASASIDVALDIAVTTGAIRGRVVDGGHPASDAFVTFALEHDDEPGRSSSDREVLVAADGTFVANELAAGTYSIRARRKGAGEIMQRHVAIGTSVVLELPPAGAIAIAASSGGAPVDDVTVSLTRVDDTMQERYEQRTGVHGEIALRDVSPGRYVVSVAAHDAHARSEVTVVAGQTASVVFDLEPRVTLVGRVVDARSGRPVPQTSIVVTPETGAMVGLMVTNTYITDAEGRFAVEHVPRGSVAVTTQLPDASMQAVSTNRTIPHGGPAGEVIDLGDLRVAPVPANRGLVGCSLSIADVPRAPVIVTSVTPDTPAARAGLVVGDIVTAIDGIDVTGDHNNEASVLLDGSEGATLNVTVQRGVTVTIVLE